MKKKKSRSVQLLKTNVRKLKKDKTFHKVENMQFKFYINHHLHFAAHMDSERCESLKKNNQQCGRNTVIGLGCCWQHMLTDYHLRIKESNIPNSGKGLFAMDKSIEDNAILFRKGDSIINYDGEIIDLAQLHQRFGNYTAPYTVYINNNRFTSAEFHRGIGSLANHGNSSISNETFNTGNRGNNAICTLKAKKNIRNGDEIIVNYGKSYKFNEPTNYTTK
jgi:hypothetical protein